MHLKKIYFERRRVVVNHPGDFSSKVFCHVENLCCFKIFLLFLLCNVNLTVLGPNCDENLFWLLILSNLINIYYRSLNHDQNNLNRRQHFHSSCRSPRATKQC